MKNTTIFCLTLNPEHENLIERLSYIPVGLGNKNFSKNFFTDKTGNNISNKNSFYGEYTFHYWIWKNYLNNIKTDWVGFCQYRKFFVNKIINEDQISFSDFENCLIKNAEINHKDFDCILGEKFSVENYKLSKIFKNHFFHFLKRPSLFFNKKKRNLKFHFDLFHGEGNLEKAIELLDEDNKDSFTNYMNRETSFCPHNMFICKTDILKNYYDTVFPWLKRCESIFGFNNLDSYGLKRIYGFLAERFLSFWFLKNYNCKELPILFKNLSDYKNL